MWNTLLIVLILVGFGAPWTWLLYRRGPATLEDLLDRVCLGYAIAFVVLFVASQFRLWAFLPLWITAVIACLVDLRRRADPARGPFTIGREGKILLGAASLYLGLRCLPFLVRRLPLGWDAYFHMTISESIFARGQAVHDWLPFENIPLNYPIGAHLLLAFMQWLTNVRPHLFFELLVVWFTLLSGLQLFSLALRATQDRAVACYAALVYLFLGNYGSLHYAIWSGLPNLIGMYLFLGLLSFLARDEPSSWRSTAIFATFFLGACFVHHHVMVTAGLCLGWMALSAFSRDRPLWKRIAQGLVASALLGSPYFLMYLLRTVSLSNTGIEAYMENTADPWTITQDIGIGFTASVLPGIYLYFKNEERVSRVVTQPLAVMLVMYVLVEFCVRTYSLVIFEHEISPFTPSRFLTDAVTLLSIFAGIFLRTMQGAAQRNQLAIVAIVVAGFFVFNRGTYRDTFMHEVARERRAVYSWIRKNTPENATLLDEDLHATYLTRRMSSSFPLPTSEFSSLAANQLQLDAVRRGHEPPERVGRPVFAVVDPGKRAPPGTLRFQHRGIRVIEVFTPPAPAITGSQSAAR